MPTTHHVLYAYLGIVPRTPEAAVLRLLVELGVQYVRADEGSLLALDQRKNQLVFAMTAGPAESEQTLLGQRVPLGKGLTGLAAATREVQIGAPTFKDIKQRKRMGAASGEPAAVMAAPMLIRDEVVGVITAASFDTKKRFTGDDATLYAKIATVAAVVVDQHRRLREIENLGSSDSSHRRRVSAALTPTDRLQAEIVDRVGTLVRKRPDRLPQIKTLLDAIDSLTGR